MNEALEAYILQHIDDEGELLAKLNRDAHVNLLRPRMLSGHLQGRMLKMFCKMMNPKNVLEIGTYTGYATMCLAEGLSLDAEIDTIEINDELEDFIRKYINQSPLKDKINLHIGDALEIIPNLNKQFDLVFLDADKRLYCEYFDLLIDRMKSGGLIIADNTLWDGKVLETPHHTDLQTIGIIKFNDMIAADKRVEKVILPIRDGLTLIRKI